MLFRSEDTLRILRLFRMHAWYGHGEIEPEGLQACAAARGLIARLSGERIQKEMLKLLAAAAPVPVLRTMAATSILAEILPGQLSFERFARLCAIDDSQFFDADALLRLGALLGSGAQAGEISGRWRLSNDQRDRLAEMFSQGPRIVSYMSIREVRRALYRLGQPVFRDQVRLRWSEDGKESNGVQWRTLLALADGWVRPQMPLTGADVMKAGVPHGPLVGRVLAEVEDWWIDSDFTDDPFSIAERLKAVVQATI